MCRAVAETSCELSVLPHQDHDDRDEQQVEGGEREDHRMFPVQLEHVLLLSLLPLLALLSLQGGDQWQAGAGGRVVGLVRRARVGWRAEARAGLVVPDPANLEAGGYQSHHNHQSHQSHHLEAGRGRLGVRAVAAARLLLPHLV